MPDPKEVIVYKTENDHRWGQIASGSTIPTAEDWRKLRIDSPPSISDEPDVIESE